MHIAFRVLRTRFLKYWRGTAYGLMWMISEHQSYKRICFDNAYAHHVRAFPSGQQRRSNTAFQRLSYRNNHMGNTKLQWANEFAYTGKGDTITMPSIFSIYSRWCCSSHPKSGFFCLSERKRKAHCLWIVEYIRLCLNMRLKHVCSCIAVCSWQFLYHANMNKL